MLLSWCEWHVQVLCSIYGNIDKGISRSICHHGRKEKECHDNDSETVPRQRIGYPVAHGDTGEKGSDGSVSCKMMGWSRLPGSHGWTAWQRGTHKEQLGHGATHSSTHTLQAFGPRAVVSGLYLRSVHFRSESVQRGSSRSRDGSGSRFKEEVIVHVP